MVKMDNSSKLTAIADAVEGLTARFDAYCTRQEARGDAFSRTAQAQMAQNARTNQMSPIANTSRTKGYNPEAVNKEIAKDPRIKGAEAKAIHALLKGRS